ncbi:O-antigen ligase family protein [Nevskia soli]|uniref:O-antigen ligase family protein n=1 Tax=Nevskia soli TaxID=418856 RepID=UPI0015D7A272|nr:O-antigen ligase family protein [Nevskia soli]
MDWPALRVCCVFGVLGLTLAFAVFRSGATALLDWNLSLAGIGVASLVYWLSGGSANLSPSRIGQFAPLLPLGYVALQLLPLPAAILPAVSPGYGAVLGALKSVGLAPAFSPLALDPSVTFAHLLRLLGYLLVFLLIRELTARSLSRNAWLTAIPLICIATAEAFLAITQSLQGAEATGTYVNRNHLAGLIEMALPFAAMGILSAATLGADSVRWVRFGGAGALCVALAAMLLALVDCQSKMGLISGLAGLLVAGSLWSLLSLKRSRRWLAIGAIASLCLVCLVFLPSDELVARFGRVLTSSQNAGEGRWPIWIDTTHLIAAFPVFGAGLGNYGTAFLRYQTSVIERTFIYAHNDYLQLLAELGIVGFLILAAVTTPIALRPFRAAPRNGHRNRYLACACAGAFSAIALHSLSDFNLYIPANAVVFAWILGISAGLPLASLCLLPRSRFRTLFPQIAAVTLSIIAVLCASLWIVSETDYAANPRAHAVFCGLGLCDAGAAAFTISDRERAVRANPASPFEWCDLGESFAASGRRKEAQSSYSSALEFGPFVPPVLIRVASFEADRGSAEMAIGLTARLLSKTATYDSPIFDWYISHRIPAARVIASGLAGNSRSAGAYMRYLLGAGEFDEALTLWKWMIGRSYADNRLARDYTAVLWNNADYAKAAHAWKSYLGPNSDGYLATNWIYNGGFETEPAGPILDWEIQPRDDVEVTEDATVAHTGNRSLRLRFDGKKNVDYQQVRQEAFVPPGTYRFEAYVRAAKLTTDEGIRFRIFDPEGPHRLDLLTDGVTGTQPWTKITREIVVPGETRVLEIRVVRKPSLRFDSNLAGTAWIDSLALSKAGLQSR